MAPEGPHSGAVATGAPLAVVDDVKVWTTTSKEKVGETEYKDENGATFATANVYQDKTTTHTQKIWYPVQGKAQLSDEDFFRIAGDQPALDQTLAMRADGKKWNHRGYATLAGGAVGMIVGFFIPNAPVKSLFEIAGGLAVAGGYYMSWYGAHEESPDTHAVDRSLADRAANDYNQQLGHSVGMNYKKSF
jgi:hypothetical protein